MRPPRSTASLLSWMLLTILLAFVSLSAASAGDDLKEFKACVAKCIEENCNRPSPAVLPLHLRLLFWDCPSECDYTCQRHITALRIESSKKILQFHGKWPFLRFYGVQEPFSVIFSILNGYQHYRGLKLLDRELPKNYPMKVYYMWFGYVGMACWLFSSIFHTRDSIPTERLDYFGAGANVMYGLFFAPIRIFHLYNRRQHSPQITIWGVLCLSAYLSHVYYLQFVKWDYGYNMTANIIVGSMQNLLWSYFSWREYMKKRKMWTLAPAGIVVWMIVSMSLELLDFPPMWDAIDAHSLWHAATILPVAWWYRFLVRDAREDMYSFRRIK